MTCDKLQDAPLTAGDSRTIAGVVTNDGIAVNLTGWTVAVTMTDGTTTITPSVTVTDALAGEFEFTISGAQSAQYTADVRLECRITITQGATVYTVLRDKYLTILQ